MIPLQYEEFSRANRGDRSSWAFSLNILLSAPAPGALRGRKGSHSHLDSSSVP